MSAVSNIRVQVAITVNRPHLNNSSMKYQLTDQSVIKIFNPKCNI